MKHTEKRFMRHIGINVVILLLAIVILLVLAQRENHARQMLQIDEYISELSARTAQHIGDVFQNQKDEVSSLACLYGLSLHSP